VCASLHDLKEVHKLTKGGVAVGAEDDSSWPLRAFSQSGGRECFPKSVAAMPATMVATAVVIVVAVVVVQEATRRNSSSPASVHPFPRAKDHKHFTRVEGCAREIGALEPLRVACGLAFLRHPSLGRVV